MNAKAIAVAFLVTIGAAGTVRASEPPAPTEATSIRVLEWFKLDPVAFGCWMERTYGHRSARWNCSARKPASYGDPCKNVGAYYDGPDVPEKVVKRMPPTILDVHLEWEGGRLRLAIIQVAEGASEESIRRTLGLPLAAKPPDFAFVGFRKCLDRCFVLEKAAHMGAGEADCPVK